MTSPTSLTRCGITMQPVEGPLPADGGSAVINVAAARECAWSATVEGSWLSLKAGANGQGDGTVELAASANPDPVMRRGAVVANGQRADISQAAAECALSLGESSASFSQSGGSGQIPVRASSSMCPWSASADADWVRIRTASGQGNGLVSFDVPASTGPPRGATITVASQKFSIIQSEGCTYTIGPASTAAGAAGGAASVAVTTTAGCPWTASSNVPWLTLAPIAGIGSASVAVSIAATSGKGRTGTAVIAGQPFSVTQSAGCAYTVQPANAPMGAAGGTVSVTIASNPECDWTASANDPWITIQGRASGSGAGTVTLAVAATSGPSRSGSATIAGQRVTIAQGQGCTYATAPESASAPSSASTGKVTVTAAAGCNWTASSNDAWLTISAGSSGSGGGDVQYAVAATTGPSRSGTMTIAGRTFTVHQGDGCSYSLSATGQSVPATGGSGTVNVTSGGSCSWTAASNASWLSVTSGASGSGNGTVGFSATANAGPERKGTLTIGGKTFTVTQAESCSFTIAPDQAPVGAAAGTTAVTVTAPAGCGWTAAVQAPWLGIAAGASGSGNGTVQVSFEANAAAPRSGTATIAGRTFTVNQAGGCTYSISPAAQTVPAAGGAVQVSVTASASCPWSSTSNAPWLTLPSGGAGNGPGMVQVDAQANPGSPRSGTVTIAGQTLTISQESGCTYVVAPEVLPAAAGGGNAHIDVSANASCAWTASSAAAWITIVSAAAGTGAGGIDIASAANTGPARSGTLLVAGRTVTVNQDSGCTITLGAPSTTIPASGGPGSVSVTSSAGCTWTAVSNAPWITVTGGSPGSGTAIVTFSVEPNGTGAPRSGTIAIGNAAFTVNEQ